MSGKSGGEPPEEAFWFRDGVFWMFLVRGAEKKCWEYILDDYITMSKFYIEDVCL